VDIAHHHPIRPEGSLASLAALCAGTGVRYARCA